MGISGDGRSEINEAIPEIPLGVVRTPCYSPTYLPAKSSTESIFENLTVGLSHDMVGLKK